jgi:transposase
MRRKTNAQEIRMLDRRQSIAQLYVQGLSQRDIAKRVKVNQGTVSRDLAAIRETWLESATRDFSTRKAEELAKIDAMESEAWAAWQRSKEDWQRNTKEKIESTGATTEEQGKEKRGTPAAGGNRMKVSVATEGRLPAHEYMRIVQWCIGKRCEILGLDAPKKHEHSGPGGKAIQLEEIREFRNLPRDELMRRYREALQAPDADEEEPPKPAA